MKGGLYVFCSFYNFVVTKNQMLNIALVILYLCFFRSLICCILYLMKKLVSRWNLPVKIRFLCLTDGGVVFGSGTASCSHLHLSYRTLILIWTRYLHHHGFFRGIKTKTQACLLKCHSETRHGVLFTFVSAKTALYDEYGSRSSLC